VTTRVERRAQPRVAKEARHRAREAAVQMLYQWEVGRASITEVMQTFWLHDDAAGQELSDEHRIFAEALVRGVAGEVGNIDPVIGEAAENWRLERMNVLDRLILRLAVYEFLHETGTPAKVVINEALELARTFSNDDAVRFVNGILDAVRKRLERE
jgi:N utilization substance protein B